MRAEDRRDRAALRDARRSYRRRAFAVLWFGQFSAIAGLTVVVPLLPFYLAGMGVPEQDVAWWTGVSLAAPASPKAYWTSARWSVHCSACSPRRCCHRPGAFTAIGLLFGLAAAFAVRSARATRRGTSSAPVAEPANHDRPAAPSLVRKQVT